MTDYVPLAIQKRRRLIHRCGTVAIAVIYGLAIAGMWLAPENWSWPIVGITMVLPPLIEFLLPPVTDRRGVQVKAARLPYLLLVGIIIGLLAVVLLGPPWATTALGWAAAASVVAGALAAVTAWVTTDPYLIRRKLTFIGIAVFCLVMIAAVMQGPPFIRSLALGIIGAFVLALLPNARRSDVDTSGERPDWRDTGAHRYTAGHSPPYEPPSNDYAFRHDHVADSASDRFPGPRYSDNAFHIEPELQTLDTVFARAQRMIEHGFFAHIGENGRELAGSPLVLSIAALDNLGFITGTAAQRFVKAVTQAILEPEREQPVKSTLSGLYQHIDYARAQLRAHSFGARNPLFPSSD